MHDSRSPQNSSKWKRDAPPHTNKRPCAAMQTRCGLFICERAHTHSQTRIRRARRVHHLDKKALQAVSVCVRETESIRNEQHQQFLGPLWMYRPDASNVRQRSERKMGSRTIPTAGILAGEIMARIKQRHLCSLCVYRELRLRRHERERTGWQLIAICSGVDVFSLRSLFYSREKRKCASFKQSLCFAVEKEKGIRRARCWSGMQPARHSCCQRCELVKTAGVKATNHRNK